jgi:hypothetical protein
VVLSGASTSSLGIHLLRANPKNPLGMMWGTPQGIRSDEFLTATSVELNVMALGHSSSSSLAQSPDVIFGISSGQPFESLLFLESNLLRLGPWLPDTMLFAAWRAWPFLLLALTLPRLLQRLGATRPLSWLALALIVLAPASLWWSFSPLRILASASLGGLLLLVARDRWVAATTTLGRVGALGLAAVGGAALARLATSYVPWGITLGVPIVVAVAAVLVLTTQRRSGLLVLGVGAASGALLLGLTFWENSDAVRAMLDTAYPGVRRSTGEAVPFFHLFGAPGLHEMLNGEPPAIANQSEITSAFLICGVAALLLAFRPRTVTTEQRVAIGALAASTGLLLVWCTAGWGELGMSIPVLNMVPPYRSAQTIGFAATLLFCLVLSRAEPVGWRVALAVAVTCGGVTLYGVTSLRAALPTLTTADLWVASLLVALCLGAIVAFPRQWQPVVAVSALLLWAGVQVNPVILGLGDLRASRPAAVARQLGAETRAAGGMIASDDPFVSALLVSNGAPSITGWQIAGPRETEWRALDPSGSDEEMWNRAASYLRMTFDGAAGSDPVISNPGTDIINISVDPCGIPPELEIRAIISGGPLEAPCLSLERTFRWGGVDRHVYSVDPSS